MNMNFNNYNSDNVSELLDAIKQIIDLPDERLTEDAADMIVGGINGMITPKKREELVVELAKEMEANNINMDDVIEEINNLVNELVEESSITPQKERVIRSIFDIIINLMQEAQQRAGQYHSPVYFEMIHPSARIPTYAHNTDAGADIYAPETVVVPANARGFKVGTGFKMALMPSWEMQIRPRSGMSMKTPLRISNCVGTVDAGYRDEVGVLFDNISNEPYTINEGDRIAQFVLSPVYHFKGIPTESVATIGENRGGGWGSSGK